METFLSFGRATVWSSGPSGLRRWIDVKKAHAEATGVFPRNLPHLMELMGLKHEGRLHSGFGTKKKRVFVSFLLFP